jgi:hypothetical protein
MNLQKAGGTGFEPPGAIRLINTKTGEYFKNG